MTPTADTVRALFARVQKLPEADVDMAADLFAEYRLNSMRAVKLLSKLEVEYDITFPNDRVEKVKTLADVAALVDELKAPTEAAR